MCKAFSCIVTKDNKVLWKAGVDSHDALIAKLSKMAGLEIEEVKPAKPQPIKAVKG